MGWYEDMERAEQERDAQEYECAMAFSDGHIKAIDDFAREIKANSQLGYIGYLDRVIDEIAEQLKTGGKNG